MAEKLHDFRKIALTSSANGTIICFTVFVVVIYVFGAVDKTSSSFSAHGKIGNFIIIIITLLLWADQQKILRYCTKYAFFHASFIALAHVLRKLQRTPWGDGLMFDTIL